MDHFIRRMSHYVEFGEADLSPLLSLDSTLRDYSSGQRIVDFNETVNDVFVVEDGWSVRARYIEDGRRQIINFMLPGDYFDLMSVVGARSDHTVVAATDTRIRIFDGQRFLNAIQASSSLAAAFWWVTVQEEAILRQQIVRIGRLSARERIANFILELNRRQGISEGKRSDFVPMPIPQAMLADALGLSIVHVSRTLTSLKTQGLVDSNRSGITILDRDSLIELADYDTTHLSPNRLPMAAQ